jgi:hypothetical protein
MKGLSELVLLLEFETSRRGVAPAFAQNRLDGCRTSCGVFKTVVGLGKLAHSLSFETTSSLSSFVDCCVWPASRGTISELLLLLLLLSGFEARKGRERKCMWQT